MRARSIEFGQRLERGTEGSDIRLYAACYLLLFAFYLITAPSSRFEAGDAYSYAYTTIIGAWFNTKDNIEPGYHILSKVFYLLFTSVGVARSTFESGALVSNLAAPLAVVLLARLLEREFSQDKLAAWLGAGCLAFSYGFWRYAAEVEVYAPAICILLAVLNFVLATLRAPGVTPKQFLLPGAAGGLALLFYQALAIPLFVAAIPLFMRQDRLVPGLVYGMTGVIVVFLGYTCILFGATGNVPTIYELLKLAFARSQPQADMASILSLPVRMTYLVHYDLVALNWLFAVDAFVSFYGNFADNVLLHARAAATKPFAIVWLAAATYALVMILLACALAVAGLRHLPRDRLSAFLAAWLVSGTLIIFSIDRSHWEPWLMMMPAVVIVGARWLLASCIGGGKSWLAIAIVAALAVHNWIGGMALIHPRASDYLANRYEWLHANGRPADVVLFGQHNELGGEPQYNALINGLGSHLLTENGSVLRFPDEREFSLADFARERRAGGGRVFVFDDFLDPRTGQSVRFANSARLARDFLPSAKLVWQSGSTRLYELQLDLIAK